MAALLDAPDLPGDPDVGLIRPLLVVLAVAGVVALFLFASSVQGAEAGLSAVLARASGISDARQIGSSVLFVTKGATAGYDVSLGCTVAFLLLPFFVVTAGLLAIARVSAPRALASLLLAIVVVTAFNQLRLLLIAEGMHVWGARLGYARTHVLLGTIVSTIGVVSAGTAYLAVLLRHSTPGRMRPATYSAGQVHHG